MLTDRVIFAKGFRPFFLLAALFAVAFVPLWLITYGGHIDAAAHFSAAIWHGHEMIFGYTVAVVAGFLLTAVSNWTRRETATGGWLAGLCALWIVGRLAIIGAAWFPEWLVAAADLAFLPALVVAIGRPLWATNNRRNIKFVGILGLLWAANAAMHASAIGLVDGWERPALLLSLDLIIVIALIVGGRIIPMFTRNATGVATRSHKWLERAVFVGVAASIAMYLVWPASLATAAVTAAAGLAVAARMTHWGAKATWDKPILWVLHLGHAWIAVGLLLRAAAIVWTDVSAAMAIHALTVGAIGLLTLGMMARVALGHTGRRLTVARPIAWAFGAIALAALFRTAAPIVAPAMYVDWVWVSSLLWAAAFLVYLVVYTPILVRPRADGRPG
ncbi:MAG: NnrS family protein [Persicimonas sp.]